MKLLSDTVPPILMLLASVACYFAVKHGNMNEPIAFALLASFIAVLEVMRERSRQKKSFRARLIELIEAERDSASSNNENTKSGVGFVSEINGLAEILKEPGAVQYEREGRSFELAIYILASLSSGQSGSRRK